MYRPITDDYKSSKKKTKTPEIGQGDLSVSDYYMLCLDRFDKKYGRVDASNDHKLFKMFMEGLNHNIKRMVASSGVTTTEMARKEALMEEGFLNLKKPVDSADTRLHKLETLTGFCWEKTKSVEATCQQTSKEVSECRRELTGIRGLLEDVLMKLPNTSSSSHREQSSHGTSLKDALKSITPAIDYRFDMIEIQLDMIDEKVQGGYEWIRQNNIDIKKIGEPASARASPKRIEVLKRPQPQSTDEEIDHATFKKPRVDSVNQKKEDVLADLAKVLDGDELAKLQTGDVLEAVSELYMQYRKTTDTLHDYMKLPVPYILSECWLCGRKHLSDTCDEYTTIEARKKVLRKANNHCDKCARRHFGVCRAKKLHCSICENAKSDDRYLVFSPHPAIFCPIQEEYFQKKAVRAALCDARRTLSSL